MTDPTVGVIVTAICTSLPPTIMALVAWRATKRNEKAINANTTVTELAKAEVRVALKAQDVQLAVVHTLVNDLSTQGLKQLADAFGRIAVLSGLDTDKVAAAEARQKYETKVETDRTANAQTAEGHAQAQAEREKTS